MNRYDLKKHAGYGACTFIDAALMLLSLMVLVGLYLDDAGIDKPSVAVARGIIICCILILFIKFIYDMYMVKKYDKLAEEQE